MKYLIGDKAGADCLGMKLKAFQYYVSKGIIPQRKLGKRNVYISEEIESSISEIVNQ